MRLMENGLGQTIIVDPMNTYAGIKPRKILESLGLLPYFAAEVHLMEPETVREAFDSLMEVYGFGMGQKGDEWGTVEDMVYKSGCEGDPDLTPLASFKLTEDIDFLVYQYAICAVTDGTDTLMMRMD